MFTGTQDFFVGGYALASTSPWDGEIDEFLAYNKSLSYSEVQQLYYGGLNGGTTLNASQTDTGDEWYVTFRAYNATTSGTLYTSNTVTIS